jgi:hypothetical protein
MLSLIEREAVQVGHAPIALTHHVTAPLAGDLHTRLSSGVALDIRPTEIYALIVREALLGRSAASALRSAWAAGKL